MSLLALEGHTHRHQILLADHNSTTPGFDLHHLRGARGSIGVKEGKQSIEDMKSVVTWRAPDFDLQNSKVYTSIAIGPRFTLSSALPGLEKLAFDMESRFDLPKFEIALGQTKGSSTIIPKFFLISD